MNFDLNAEINQKKVIKKRCIRENWWDKTIRAIIVLQLSDNELQKALFDACKSIRVMCLDSWNNVQELSAIDAFLTNCCDESDLEKCFQYGIAPIFASNCSEKITEFNPMKFTGNGFIFEKNELFVIFEKICRFLENSSYAGDRRMLLKNIYSSQV